MALNELRMSCYSLLSAGNKNFFNELLKDSAKKKAHVN